MNVHTVIAPILKYFRTRRMRTFERSFGLTPSTTVLDVGGTPFNWALSSVRPKVTLLNLDLAYVGAADEFLIVIADGCELPFKDLAFDIVFCNSVIEHVPVGTHRARLAREIRRVGRRYFVQTPNKWFPLEPHFLTPFFQFLPKRTRVKLARNFTVWGWITRASKVEAERLVTEIELLDSNEFKGYFPDAIIETESLFTFRKSLIATRVIQQG